MTKPFSCQSMLSCQAPMSHPAFTPVNLLRRLTRQRSPDKENSYCQQTDTRGHEGLDRGPAFIETSTRRRTGLLWRLRAKAKRESACGCSAHSEVVPSERPSGLAGDGRFHRKQQRAGPLGASERAARLHG
jgi:hypothetical protein